MKKKEKKDEMTIFDHLNNLTLAKKPADFNNDEFSKTYNRYMTNRWISMVEHFLPIVNEINKFDVPDSVHYNYYFSILPKRKIYFNYIKKKKDINEDDKKYIADYFECGKSEAERYINMLEDEELEEILKIYRYGKNKMIQL